MVLAQCLMLWKMTIEKIIFLFVCDINCIIDDCAMLILVWKIYAVSFMLGAFYRVWSFVWNAKKILN